MHAPKQIDRQVGYLRASQPKDGQTLCLGNGLDRCVAQGCPTQIDLTKIIGAGQPIEQATVDSCHFQRQLFQRLWLRRDSPYRVIAHRQTGQIEPPQLGGGHDRLHPLLRDFAPDKTQLLQTLATWVIGKNLVVDSQKGTERTIRNDRSRRRRKRQAGSRESCRAWRVVDRPRADAGDCPRQADDAFARSRARTIAQCPAAAVQRFVPPTPAP